MSTAKQRTLAKMDGKDVYRLLFKEKWEISGRRFTVDLHFCEISFYREFYLDYESPLTEVVFNWKKSPYSTRSRAAAPWKMVDWFNYISSSFLTKSWKMNDLIILVVVFLWISISGSLFKDVAPQLSIVMKFAF
jgi:hypothetical protein